MRLFVVIEIYQTQFWLRELSYFKRGWDEEKIIDRATKEQLIFRDFVKFIKILSSKFPRKKIVFRPHPIEKESDWKKIFYDYKNIIVNNSNEIGHWITNSSLVIHNGCTGGLEASLRNKKVIAFSPKGLNIGHKFPNKVSFTYKNINEAIKAVETLYNKNKVISFLNKKVKFQIDCKIISIKMPILALLMSGKRYRITT